MQQSHSAFAVQVRAVLLVFLIILINLEVLSVLRDYFYTLPVKWSKYPSKVQMSQLPAHPTKADFAAQTQLRYPLHRKCDPSMEFFR